MDARRGRPVTVSGAEVRTSRRAVIVRGLAFWPLSLLVVCAKPEHLSGTPPPPSASQSVIAPQGISTVAPVAPAAPAAGPLATVARPTATAPAAARPAPAG